jgi:hypothetical protein
VHVRKVYVGPLNPPVLVDERGINIASAKRLCQIVKKRVGRAVRVTIATAPHRFQR